MINQSINQLKDIVDTFIHNGLTTYSPTNKRFVMDTDRNRKGTVFLVRNKRDFNTNNGFVKGFIVTSKESLISQLPFVSHWTPNVYRYGQYTNTKRTHIKGHSEGNLQQINAFVFETDHKRLSVNEILLACIDSGLDSPTMIVESERGYHVYFALEKPVFLNANNLTKFKEIKVLATAKRISKNIKEKLNDVIGVDKDCNSFGFFRAPNPANIVWFSKEMTYPFKHFVNWSMKYESDKYVVAQNEVKFVKPALNDYLNWLQPLKDNAFIKGEKGQIGRNNLFFTIALSFKAAGRSLDEAYDFIDQYNSEYLKKPLEDGEIKTLLKSAFEGKYKAPSNDYIKYLIELYGVRDGFSKFKTKGWYKFKKERSQRQRSHFDEWERDIVRFIESQIQENETFIWYTQKELCEKLMIPQSSLNVVLKSSKRILKTVIGKGRGARTGWSTVSIFLRQIINSSRAKQDQYRTYIGLLQYALKSLKRIGGYSVIENIYQSIEKKIDKRNGQLQQISMTHYLELLSVANE